MIRRKTLFFPENWRRGPAWLAAVALVGAASPLVAQTPGDFRLVAQGGALSPDYSISIVLLDSTGIGLFCDVQPQDRLTLHCTQETPLALSAAGRDSIWTAIQDHGFFALDPSYLDTSLVGGTWADLRVFANGLSHAVHSQNVAVPGLDAIMMVINGVLPPSHQIVYNEIVP